MDLDPEAIRRAIDIVGTRMPTSADVYLRAVVARESLRSIGAALGTGWDAARQRAHRARVALLEQLDIPRGGSIRERREVGSSLDVAVRAALTK